MIARKFEEQVRQTPHNIALKTDEVSFTYNELNRYANRIAHLILKAFKHSDETQRVSLLFDHGPDMIAAVLGVLKAGKTYVPLAADYPDNRLSYMIENSQSALALTQAKHEARVRCLIQCGGVQCLAVDRELEYMVDAEENPGIEIPGDRLAYIMYTSGSTGKPKGVMQNHENVLYYISNWTRIFSITGTDRMTLFSSFCHDGSVQDMFGALLNGAALYPVNIKDRHGAFELSEFLSKGRITIWHSVHSLFAYFADSLAGQEDFSALRWILLGGEPIRTHEIDLFKKFFPHTILANVYGQTESSVDSIWLIHGGDAIKRMTIGEPLDRTRIFILDKNYREVDEFEVGEIVAASPHISPGYWQDEEATKKVFKQSKDYGMLYFTGDLGRLLPAGKIEFMGRKDYQVKLRGFRIEPGEIESELLKHPLVKEAVVTARQIAPAGGESGETYLCAYIVARGGEITSRELREYLSRALPDYMIPSYFVFLEKIPLTANGKIDRRSLPAPVRVSANEYTPPRDEIEKKVAAIWQNVLNTSPDPGINDNFFAAGGHSLRGAILAARIHKEFDVKISLARVFDFPTIRKLAEYIKSAGRDKFSIIEPVEKKSYYALSFNQKRLWFIHQREPNSPAFNMPLVIELPHEVNGEALKKAAGEISRRHESLRTGFKCIDGEPVQYIIPRLEELSIRELDLSCLADREKEQNWKQVFQSESRYIFDLEQVPLFRLMLVKLAPQDYRLILVMHHIISDGWSMEIFQGEFLRLYEWFRGGEEIRNMPLKTRYKDFAEWYNRRVNDGAGSESYRFWKQRVGQGVPRLELPRNITGENPGSRGAFYCFMVPHELGEKIRELSKTANTTRFMVLFTAYIITLARYSNQHEIACSIISAGREHESVYPVIGFFVNSILFKFRLSDDTGFVELLGQVQNEALECFHHQSYPLEIIFEKLGMRYPDIPVSFNMVNIPGSREIRHLEPYTPYHSSDAFDAKFDLEPYIIEYKNGIDIRWAYKKSMFDALAIESFAADFIKLLEFFTGDPGKSYSDFKASGKKRQFKRNIPAAQPLME